MFALDFFFLLIEALPLFVMSYCRWRVPIVLKISPTYILRVPDRRIYCFTVEFFFVVNVVEFVVFLTVALSFKFHG